MIDDVESVDENGGCMYRFVEKLKREEKGEGLMKLRKNTICLCWKIVLKVMELLTKEE